MAEERRQVLEMLAAGTITAEQAARLLETLDDGGRQSDVARAPGGASAHQATGGARRGRPALTPEELVPLRALGITATYVQEMRQALGYAELTPAQLMPLKGLGITAAYVHEMREAGLGELSPEQLLPLKAVGVDAAYVQELRALGYDGLSAQQLVTMKATGVDAGYVREMDELRADNREEEDEEA